MGRVMINGEIRCYECGKEQHQMRGYQCPDGLYVAYCRTCIVTSDKLKHLRK